MSCTTRVQVQVPSTTSLVLTLHTNNCELDASITIIVNVSLT